MIIKYNDCILFQRCGETSFQSGEIYYNSLDELYYSKSIDDIYLAQDFEKLDDIIINYTYSIKDDKDYIYEEYEINF